MKKTFTTYLVMIIYALGLTISAFAQTVTQSAANKINNTNKKINNTDSAVVGTSGAINGTSGVISGAGNAIGNLGGTIASLFKKKQKNNSVKAPAGITDSTARTGNKNAIVISIAGVDYAKLKKLKDGLKVIAGVQSVDMAYSSASSSLSVWYNKNAGDLWDGLSGDISNQYNIISLNDTAISIKFKQ